MWWLYGCKFFSPLFFLGFKDIEVVFECLIFKINILTHHAYNHLTSIRKKMSNASNVTSLILGTQLRLRQNKTCATLRIEIPWKSHIYIDLNIGHVIKTWTHEIIEWRVRSRHPLAQIHSPQGWESARGQPQTFLNGF